MVNLGLIFNILFLVCCFQHAFAGVEYSKTQPLILPEQLIADDATETVNAIIPQTDLTGFSDRQIASKVIDNSIRFWWRTSPLRYSSVGQVAHRVENTLQVSKVVAPAKESQVEHRFTLDFQSLQALAQLKYSGWIKAALQYNLKDASASAEVSEKILENKDLVLSQTIDSSNIATSQISLRWGW